MQYLRLQPMQIRQWLEWNTTETRHLVFRWQSPIQIVEFDQGIACLVVTLLIRYPWLCYWDITEGEIPF